MHDRVLEIKHGDKEYRYQGEDLKELYIRDSGSSYLVDIHNFIKSKLATSELSFISMRTFLGQTEINSSTPYDDMVEVTKLTVKVDNPIITVHSAFGEKLMELDLYSEHGRSTNLSTLAWRCIQRIRETKPKIDPKQIRIVYGGKNLEEMVIPHDVRPYGTPLTEMFKDAIDKGEQLIPLTYVIVATDAQHAAAAQAVAAVEVTAEGEVPGEV